MIDLLAKALNSPPLTVSREQFSKWKRDPITEALFVALALSVLEQFEDPLPENDTQVGLALAYKRDGARELLDTLFEWKPEMGGDDD
jgi:hypothetical protein